MDKDYSVPKTQQNPEELPPESTRLARRGLLGLALPLLAIALGGFLLERSYAIRPQVEPPLLAIGLIFMGAAAILFAQRSWVSGSKAWVERVKIAAMRLFEVSLPRHENAVPVNSLQNEVFLVERGASINQAYHDEPTPAESFSDAAPAPIPVDHESSHPAALGTGIFRDLMGLPGDLVAWLRSNPRLVALVLLSMFLLVAILDILPALGDNHSHLVPFLMWLIAIVLFGVAVSLADVPEEKTATTSPGRPIGFILVGLILVALFLRTWKLSDIPFTFGGDEAQYGLEMLKVLQGEYQNPFKTAYASQPTMGIFASAYIQAALGQSVWALRLPWAVVGALTVLGVYLLGRRLYGGSTPTGWKAEAFGLTSAALLAFYHYHIHYSRLNLNSIGDPFCIVFALYFLYRASDTGRRMDWFWMGVFAGAAFFVYIGARFIVLFIPLILLYWLLYDRSRWTRRNMGGMVIAFVAFLLLTGPLLQYAYRYPNEFNSRLNQVGIVQSGWLAREVELTNQPVQEILWDQFIRSVLAFNIYPDRAPFYNLGKPFLNPVFGVLFLFGLGVVTVLGLLPGGSPRLFPLAAWYWAWVVFGSVLSLTPPQSHRLLPLTVPVVMLLTMAVFELLDLAGKAVGQRGMLNIGANHGDSKDVEPPNRILYGAVLVVLIGWFGYYSLTTYFQDYTPRRVYDSPYAAVATAAAPLLNDLKDTHQFYFIGPPFVYWGFPVFNFLVQGATVEDVLEPITAPFQPQTLTPERGLVFIVMEPRKNELVFVQQGYPMGTIVPIETDSELGARATLYIVPPGGGQP